MVFREWLKRPDGSACCVLVGTIKIVLEVRCFGVRKEDTYLRDMLNKGTAAIRANSKYKQDQRRPAAADRISTWDGLWRALCCRRRRKIGNGPDRISA